MKNLLWALSLVLAAAFGAVVTLIVLAPSDSEPPKVTMTAPVVDPFREQAPIVDPFKPDPVAGCPEGFSASGGLCVSDASLERREDAARRADDRELARAIADELED